MSVAAISSITDGKAFNPLSLILGNTVTDAAAVVQNAGIEAEPEKKKSFFGGLIDGIFKPKESDTETEDLLTADVNGSFSPMLWFAVIALITIAALIATKKIKL